MKTKRFLLIPVLLLAVCLICGMKTNSKTIHEIPPVSYKIEKEAFYYPNGTFRGWFYNLMVTNHTNEAVDVTGTYHKKGDPNEISGPFAGTVYAGKSKCLHHEIDVPFTVIEFNFRKAF